LPQSEFLSPTTIPEAVKALAATEGARLIAGGTDLLAQARSGRVRPALIIDLKRLPGLVGISETADGFVIGAATPGAQIGEHEALVAAWPGVVEAANLIGSTQIQGRASLGGNLCNASPAADSVPALIAAAAVCIIEGEGGRREAPVETIQAGPGRTTLARGEIITAFRLPRRAPRSSDAYLRLIPRTEMDIAVVGAGVNLTLDASGAVSAARVAVGAVAPTTLLVDAAGAALVGSRLDDEALAGMEAAVKAACRPISDKRGTAEYRTRIAAVLARRAAQTAYERASA
jgi:carbon-monoxide dehydrogenase medium subunit